MSKTSGLRLRHLYRCEVIARGHRVYIVKNVMQTEFTTTIDLSYWFS